MLAPPPHVDAGDLLRGDAAPGPLGLLLLLLEHRAAAGEGPE